MATAYYSTSIPNIEVYLPAPPAAALGMRLVDPLRGLLGGAAAQKWLKGQVDKRVRGPDQATRERLRTWVWGEARNAAGETRTARLETANGYEVTVHGVLLAVRHLLAYNGPGATARRRCCSVNAAWNSCRAAGASASPESGLHQPAGTGVGQVLGELGEQLAAMAPVVPVERHVDGAPGNQLAQLPAPAGLPPGARARAPAQATFGEAHEALGRGAEVMGKLPATPSDSM